jgi:hypothetical protein
MGHNTNVSEAPATFICRILYYGNEGNGVYLNTGADLTDYVTLRPRRACFIFPAEKNSKLSMSFIFERRDSK